MYFLNFAVVAFAFTFEIYISVIVFINSLYFLYIKLKACFLTFLSLFFRNNVYVLSVISTSLPFSSIKVPNLNSAFVSVSNVFSGADIISEKLASIFSSSLLSTCFFSLSISLISLSYPLNLSSLIYSFIVFSSAYVISGVINDVATLNSVPIPSTSLNIFIPSWFDMSKWYFNIPYAYIFSNFSSACSYSL